MKKAWSVRRNEEAVSPVIATILMVAITVVLAAVLYVMVLGFGGGGSSTPAATYQKASIADGQRITIVSITEADVGWTDVTIQLTDGTSFAEWAPVTEDLDDGDPLTVAYGTDALGTLTVYCNVTDISGNGFVSGSDSFTLQCAGFLSSVTYTAVLVYEPTGERIGNGITFTG